MVPYPGDPNNDDKYEASIIDNTTVKMWGIGTILNNAKQWKDGSLRIFTLAISNYIRDKSRHFQLCTLLDGTSGVVKDISKDGNIIVESQFITLNIGPGTNIPLSIHPSEKSSKKESI
ncbi:hypothetical protein K439DRAFT_1615444 [Ramaria rubella]|nr:hypothetical protein K439DRAFT_1615444 [Ramaria rubella]